MVCHLSLWVERKGGFCYMSLLGDAMPLRLLLLPPPIFCTLLVGGRVAAKAHSSTHPVHLSLALGPEAHQA